MRNFLRSFVMLLAGWLFMSSAPGTAQGPLIPRPYIVIQRPMLLSVRARFMGTSTILFDDGTDQILIDGFFTRPSRQDVLFGRIAPNPAVIEAALARAGVADRLRAVLVAHSHFDHALDAPTVAQRTGALLVGSASTRNIGLGGGLPDSQIQVVADGARLTFGAFRITIFGTPHSPNPPFPGTITTPLTPPARASAYLEGGSFSFLIEHQRVKILVQPSANFAPGRYRGLRADIVFLSIGTLGRQSAAFAQDYWREVVQATGAGQVFPIHWDDFFVPVGDRFEPMLSDNVGLARLRVTDMARGSPIRIRDMPPFEPVLMAPPLRLLRRVCERNPELAVCVAS